VIGVLIGTCVWINTGGGVYVGVDIGIGMGIDDGVGMHVGIDTGMGIGDGVGMYSGIDTGEGVGMHMGMGDGMGMVMGDGMGMDDGMGMYVGICDDAGTGVKTGAIRSANSGKLFSIDVVIDNKGDWSDISNGEQFRSSDPVEFGTCIIAGVLIISGVLKTVFIFELFSFEICDTTIFLKFIDKFDLFIINYTFSM
jgi:hypothetical protein